MSSLGTRRRLFGAGVVLTAASLGIAVPAPAQFPPDSLKNLKVFPQDTKPRELINIMRGFAMGLGVRCQFCHVGEEGQPLSEFDFVADEKPTKRKAREMVRMVQAINDQHLANLEERSDPRVAVSCETCHRGVSKPMRIQSILTVAYQEGGTDAAIAKYRELRQQYYGGFSYDFSEGMLNEVGADLIRAAAGSTPPEELAQSEQIQTAIAVLNLNLGYYPNSAFAHFVLGEAFRIRGDTTAAIASFAKSLELAPDNQGAVRRLEQLRGN